MGLVVKKYTCLPPPNKWDREESCWGGTEKVVAQASERHTEDTETETQGMGTKGRMGLKRGRRGQTGRRRQQRVVGGVDPWRQVHRGAGEKGGMEARRPRQLMS